MSRKSILGRLIPVSSFAIAFAFTSLWSAHAQQRSNFTGTVTKVEEGSDGAIAHFRFAPGARTKWHSHERGQIILVEEGVARTQVRGGPVVELHAGDIIYAPPGVVHWHGAAPDKECIQYNVTRGAVTWFEEVSETDYTAAPKK